MKQSNTGASGTTSSIIVPTYPNRGRGRFDPWLSHSANPVYWDVANCVSGGWVNFAYGTLNDGITWNWFDPTLLSSDQVIVILAATNDYTVKGWPGIWIGEGFNHVLRPRLTMKLTNDDFLAWCLSH